MDALPIHSFQPRRPSGAVDPLQAYRDRDQLTDAQRALLKLLRDLMPHGVAWSGERFLAKEMKLSVRHVRRLLGQLHGKGMLAITHRVGKTSLYKVLRDRPDEPDQPLRIACENPAPPRTSVSAPPGHPCPPRVRTPMSANKNKRSDYSDAGPLFDRAHKKFNPWAPRIKAGEKYDNRMPEKRLADGFREGLVLFVQVGRTLRTIAEVKYGTTDVFLQLAVEGAAAGQTEPLRIPIRELGGWWFGR